MHVLVTRPEPDALKLKGQLEARGHAAHVEPLHAPVYDVSDDLDLEGVTALVATSRHALIALEQRPELLAQARRLTVFTVGAATANAARQMGFRTVVKGPGTAAALIPMIASTLEASEEVLLHLAGERLAVDVAGELERMGFHASAVTVYRMQARESLSERTQELIADGDLEAVLLMSGEAATTWVRLIKKHRMTGIVQRLEHLCLSAGIARALAPLAPAPIEVTGGPTVEEMLALVDLADAQSGL
jgi:uroporphyrinogen-III synthase